MKALRYFWDHQRPVLILLAGALAVLSYFAIDFALGAYRFNDPDRMQRPIEPWMTPRFVSRTFDIPRDEFLQLLELEQPEGRPPNMGEIAENLGMSLTDLEVKIREFADTREERRK